MCTDIRLFRIEGAILLAIVAAIISLAHYDDNGSPANASFLNAAHWALVFMLLGVRFDFDKYVSTDIELVYFVYGVLVGEVELDSVLVLALVVISMMCYRMHRVAQLAASATAATPTAVPHDDPPTTYNEGTV